MDYDFMRPIKENKEPKCERCGTTESVELRVNPYNHDMDDDDTEEWLCPDCYDDLRMST